MKISIIIPTFNRREILRPLLQFLLEEKKTLSEANIEIIVADDLSTDGTSEMLPREFPEVIVVKGVGKDAAYAKRSAIEVSTGDYIVSLDDDAMPHIGWLKAVLPDIIRGEKLIQSKIVFRDLGQEELKDESAQYFRTGFKWNMYPILLLNGGYQEQYLDLGHEFGLFISRDVLEQEPFNDPNLFLDYGESASFSLRCFRRGYKIFFQPKAVIDHLGAFGGGLKERAQKTAIKKQCTPYAQSMVHNFMLFARMRSPIRIPILIIYYLLVGIVLSIMQKKNCFKYFIKGIWGGLTIKLQPMVPYKWRTINS